MSENLACPLVPNEFPRTNSISESYNGKSGEAVDSELLPVTDSTLVDGVCLKNKESVSLSTKEESLNCSAMEVENSSNSQGYGETTKCEVENEGAGGIENNKLSLNDKHDGEGGDKESSGGLEAEDSEEGLDLHLSETQSFLPSAGKATEPVDEDEEEELKSAAEGGDGDKPEEITNGETEEEEVTGKEDAGEKQSNGELGGEAGSGGGGEPTEEVTPSGKGSGEEDDEGESDVKPKEETEQPMETEEEDPPKKATAELDESAPCDCDTSCHSRMQKVSSGLESACSQLDQFIKLKRREENKLLKNFLEMLREMKDISENIKLEGGGESKITPYALIPQEETRGTGGGRRKSAKRKSSEVEEPLDEPTARRHKSAPVTPPEKKAPEEEKMSEADFIDLKGLPVFAKWPNSGWYYPGKVEALSATDWKEATSVTVKFYDGLVRDMKNINILPAHLIPSGSVLCDLEDETEMVVVSSNGLDESGKNVGFKLSVKDSPEEVSLHFNKLAIKALSMKLIKQQLETTTDVAAKKMHMVSLDNLVSGRRSRVRPKRDDSDTEERTPTSASSRQSRSSTPGTKSTPRRSRN